MTNPIKGEVPLTLSDERELVLVFDMEALIEAEEAYGKPLPELMIDLAHGYMRAGRALLFGALRAKHPEISMRDAGEMFRADTVAINTALEQALTAAFPKAGAQEEEGNVPPPRGKRSGRSGVKRG